MGVTIKCKKTGREMNVGYFGFFKLRTKVAELVGSEVGEHYKQGTSNQNCRFPLSIGL